MALQSALINVMEKAAKKAGYKLARDFGEVEHLQVSRKGPADFVSKADLRAEQTIVNELKTARPQFGFILEEGADVAPADGYNSVWIIDPLDGTTNFIKGIPHFAVSIAIKVKGKLDQAVVFDPIRGEIFTASRGKGAQLNGTRMRVKAHKDLSATILATGFPFKQKQHTNAYMAMLSSLFQKTSDIRRAGSAALDLAYVAAGRVDGFFEIGLKPWDTAAGELLVIEAGGLVTDFTGGHNHTKSGNIVATSPGLLKEILKDIRPHLGEALSK